MNRETFLSDRDLASRYKIARGSVWRWPKQNNFPMPVKLGEGTTRWRLSDIERWEMERAANTIKVAQK